MSGSVHTSGGLNLADAEERLWFWVGEIDRACNRFRPDSEISRLNATPGVHRVSPTLSLALRAATRAYDISSGACDPTILSSLEAWGYDRDFTQLATEGEVPSPTPAPGFERAHFDPATSTVSLEPGVRLDLGASAKALLADLVVTDVSERGGVCVEVGGDVALAGAGPEGPWVIGVSDSLTITGHEPRVAMTAGALATSSTRVRSWTRQSLPVHHIIDPATGRPAEGPFVSATVSATDCVSANALSTAALIWGEDAPFRIAQGGSAARLVKRDGTLVLVGGWPQEETS
jgi:thiamine biosynthesis lipoprotein